MRDVRYYIIYPGGRVRIQADCDADAIRIFHTHWTAEGAYSCEGRRVLMKEERTVMHTTPVVKAA